MKGKKMVKRLLIAMVTLLCCVGLARAEVQEEGFTTWLLGDYNQMGVRGGYAWDNIELGIQSYWWLWEDENPDQAFGFYGLYDFPGPIDMNDIPVLSPLAPHISAAGYVGFQGTLEFQDEEERGYLGPIVGIALTKLIFDETDDLLITGTEVQWIRYVDNWKDARTENEELRFLFFLRIKF